MEMINNVNTLLQKLQEKHGDTFSFDQGAIEKEVEIQSSQFSNLAVKILSVIGGVLGSLFFLGFLMIFGMYDTPVVALVMGVILILVALGIDRNETSVLLDTFSISNFLIGGFLIGFGLVEETGGDENLLILVAMVIALISFFFAKGFMLRMICVLIFNGSWLALILENSINIAFHFQIIFLLSGFIYLSFFEAKLISKNAFWNSIYKPLHAGFLVSLSFALFLLANSWKVEVYFFYDWISSIAIFLSNIFVVFKIIERLKLSEEKNKMWIYGLSVFVLLPTFLMPSIGGAILVLLASYHIGHRVGIALGMIGLVYFGMQFYYDLNLTLLVKSIILMVSGVMFLSAYYFYNKTFTAELGGDKNSI
ncbi:MAG: DUF4401 domain-containing protein [Saprospiraceae bacterium]